MGTCFYTMDLRPDAKSLQPMVWEAETRFRAVGDFQVCSSATNRFAAEFSLPFACLACIHKISIVCTAAETACTSQDSAALQPFSASFTGSYKGYLSRPTHLWRWSVFMHSGQSPSIAIFAGGALNQSNPDTRAHSRPGLLQHNQSLSC